MRPLPISVAAVAAMGLVNLFRGTVHVVAPDGGLGTIAGLDTSAAPELALTLIGAVGLGQLAFALVDFTAVLRYREFVRPLLLIHLAQAMGGTALLVFWRPFAHAIPGQYGAFAAVALLALVAGFEFGRKRDAAS